MAISSSGYADGSSHRHQSFQLPFPKMKFSLVSFFLKNSWILIIALAGLEELLVVDRRNGRDVFPAAKLRQFCL